MTPGRMESTRMTPSSETAFDGRLDAQPDAASATPEAASFALLAPSWISLPMRAASVFRRNAVWPPSCSRRLLNEAARSSESSGRLRMSAHARLSEGSAAWVRVA
eukprot:3042881-Prymnesium_polylepis.1